MVENIKQKLTRGEAVAELIKILERVPVDERHQVILSVAVLYDPDPDDGQPLEVIERAPFKHWGPENKKLQGVVK